MYKVLIGLNIKLNDLEEWDENNGGELVLSNEVRFDKGDIVKAFPECADVEFLIEMKAIEEVKEGEIKKAAKRKVVKDE